jgi:hypothetical protein
MQHRPRLRPRATIVSSTLVAAGAFGLAVLTAAPAQAAPTAATAAIDAPATVTIGTAFDVELTIPDTADVYAYEITLEADSVQYRDDSVTGPDGGFDSVEQDGDALTIVHTRLGTSPALDGDLATSRASPSSAPTARRRPWTTRRAPPSWSPRPRPPRRRPRRPRVRPRSPAPVATRVPPLPPVTRRPRGPTRPAAPPPWRQEAGTTVRPEATSPGPAPTSRRGSPRPSPCSQPAAP